MDNGVLNHSLRRAGTGKRGTGRGRGGARKRTERPAKSAADLDAEMEVSCLGSIVFQLSTDEPCRITPLAPPPLLLLPRPRQLEGMVCFGSVL